ncbi:hypothetical protein M758_6G130400 [Ceratodon purpureus]|uniref:Secreted protein n=1 Tax=Ceratodon purpureus TaxID=3225 RepID=A0A8T0HH55_CERPU|nr:hypothetical protein KC19_6G135900 [Ceratodon purpureus]KAG0613792.1 hypothetical protein M758_6G130400 [Ceratodon purpureus]
MLLHLVLNSATVSCLLIHQKGAGCFIWNYFATVCFTDTSSLPLLLAIRQTIDTCIAAVTVTTSLAC